MSEESVQEGLLDGDVWNLFDEAEKTAKASGGNVGLLNLSFAWKVFADSSYGFSQNETLFPYELGNSKNEMTANSRKARNKAAKFIVENGLDKNPSPVFAIRVYKDHVLSKEVTWKDDQVKLYFINSQLYADIASVIREKCKEKGIANPLGDIWGMFAWIANPYPNPKKPPKMEVEKDAEGNTIYDENTGEPKMKASADLVMVITDLYASKEEAMAVLGNESDDDSVPAEKPAKKDEAFPKGYDASSWPIVAQEIKLEWDKPNHGDYTEETLAKTYEVSVEWVQKAINA